LYKVLYLESFLYAINSLSKRLTSKAAMKQIWQKFQAQFGQSEFVQILTKFFLFVNDGVFSWFTRNHRCGKSDSL